MGAGHARSRYLNRKEGDAEGRASDWSEVGKVDSWGGADTPARITGDSYKNGGEVNSTRRHSGMDVDPSGRDNHSGPEGAKNGLCSPLPNAPLTVLAQSFNGWEGSRRNEAYLSIGSFHARNRFAP
ncbi:hypothetical protein KY290_025738 [Solanum tuberosum]|uniref:Uncharacterized protein n=1 Tax=Solanum tuberosum TaxID=4113 RepID=A0ABQ7UWF0_SOLTU|nr:hypothetical protein KY289_024799 [Solanum tuberosum]KAH0676750.1 hypothetical protein KY285_024551 [Solanum tuberosum]KAH0755468.1 hypothetical protein KY290_025738 [Solanum tuberosum]